MTVTNIKLKVLPRFPANVVGSGFTTITKVGATYTFGVDYTRLGIGTVSNPATSYVAVADSTGALSAVTVNSLITSSLGLTANGVVIGNGIGSPLTATAAGTNGQLLLGLTGGAPSFKTMSQDGTMSSAGVLTVTKTNNVSFGALATVVAGTGIATAAANAANVAGGLIVPPLALTANAIMVGGGSGTGPSTIAVGTAGQIPIGQTSAAPIFATVAGDATLNTAGTLTVTKTNGTSFGALATVVPGTGIATAAAVAANTAGGILVPTGALTANGIVLGGGSGVTPTTTIAGTNGQIPVGATGGAPVFQTVSGDGTLSSIGALSVTKTGGVAFTTYATATQGQLPGIASATAATAGNIGERVTAQVLSGSAISISSGTPVNVTTGVALTTGDWEVTGIAYFTPASSTTLAFLQVSSNTTTGTMNTSSGAFSQIPFPTGTTIASAVAYSVPLTTQRYLISGSQTVFMVVQASFGVSTMTCYGFIQATRVH